ncbi:hypothetical protein CISG_09283 [Coccidioides immitis RMSCC 3703]|uniref:Uncharacterized protein n=1 Tax=Coccidioides immitis RMSCC 3703 TaxID=454286 RepID=A0A0J8RB45_COCIT|nr:hypothetical protein CISG_09283 [Coccidioides immitis RMSCC 3703]
MSRPCCFMVAICIESLNRDQFSIAAPAAFAQAVSPAPITNPPNFSAQRLSSPSPDQMSLDSPANEPGAPPEDTIEQTGQRTDHPANCGGGRLKLDSSRSSPALDLWPSSAGST